MTSKLIPLLLLPIVLAACSSAPIGDVAINHALQEEATLREVADQCKDLGGAVRTSAFQARKDWWKRNGAIVRAADNGFLHNIDASFGERDQSSALTAITVTYQLTENAAVEANGILSSGNPEKGCLKILEEYESGVRDLNNDKKMREAYVNLQNQAKADFAQLKKAKGKVAKNRKYGRSLFVVENKLKQQGCTQPNISLLRNSWPLEVYDAQCADKSYFLVRCQWGKCEAY